MRSGDQGGAEEGSVVIAPKWVLTLVALGMTLGPVVANYAVTRQQVAALTDALEDVREELIVMRAEVRSASEVRIRMDARLDALHDKARELSDEIKVLEARTVILERRVHRLVE